MAMSSRTPQNQRLHDTLIETLKSVYLNKKDADEVFINPGDAKNTNVKGLYPDVIVKSRSKGVIIFEIETEDTINEAETLQWKQFFEAFGSFYLLIPDYTEQNTKNLLIKSGLTKISMVTYKWVENKLVFSQKLP
ncbi:MAG: hypothetical protein N2114_00845 [Candidatus Goldbacteria bacterium]|nr:hypothetical protein [Candidatus Goldiibacteriota bacterium]